MKRHTTPLHNYQSGRPQSETVKDEHGEHHVLRSPHLKDQALSLFDQWAQEHTSVCGTDIRYFSFDRAKSTIDPLYGEATSLQYSGPYGVRGFVEYPENQAEQREEGFAIEFRCKAWIARAEIERAHCPVPVEGDILEFWDNPFFDAASIGRGSTKTGVGGYYFDVQQVSDDGHVFDGADFVGFSLELKRYTADAPERRLMYEQGDTEECP